MSKWPPGARVQWAPQHQADYGSRLRGTVADAPRWPPLDRWLAPGERIPVDLERPTIIPERPPTGVLTITRLYVREQFLEVWP